MPLDLTPLRNSIASLEAGLDIVNDAAWFDQQSPKVRNTLLAGVIQNFECVYKISIKMIRRQLEAEAASPEEVDESSFRDIVRASAEKGLIAEVDPWFEYRLLRNITAHTYDQTKARQVYDGTLRFIVDARDLLRRLEARNV